MNEPYESIRKLISALIGAPVQVTISDSWEFVTEVQTGPLAAVIEHAFIRIDATTDSFDARESILVRLHRPLAYKKMKLEFLLASPRHFGKGLRELDKGIYISCNFLRIPELAARSSDPFQTDADWRGGPEGLIGSLKMDKRTSPRLG